MLIRILRKLGFHGRVDYDHTFFEPQWFDNWQLLSPILATLIESEPKWKSVLDFGCGPGVMIDLMNDRGINYVGCETSDAARSLYRERFGRYPSKMIAEINQLDACKYDVLLTWDVFEHMRDVEIRALLAEIPQVPELFLNISRTRGIPGHINLKSDAGWLGFFKSVGFDLDASRTSAMRSKYLSLKPGGPDAWHKNMFVFARQQ